MAAEDVGIGGCPWGPAAGRAPAWGAGGCCMGAAPGYIGRGCCGLGPAYGLAPGGPTGSGGGLTIGLEDGGVDVAGGAGIGGVGAGIGGCCC